MTPPFLQLNDQIRIVSPSGSVFPEFIDGAKDVFANWGLRVTEGKYARETYGRFAGTREQRIEDLQAALDDTSVNAILCSRGGYGLAQIIDKLDFTGFSKYPKWLIGFSDITLLHNVIGNLEIASIHGIMAKHITELPSMSHQVQKLKEILFGKLPEYSIASHALNRAGIAHGKMIGGNLSLLINARGSRFDLNYENGILFIEDIAEKAYHIDRMMQNLRFSGALEQLSGLVVGQFSDCDEDPLMQKTISEIILDTVSDYSYPVCFNFPAGHVDYNLPLILGREANLVVNRDETLLNFSQ